MRGYAGTSADCQLGGVALLHTGQDRVKLGLSLLLQYGAG
jgi:hypothetical protein